MSRWPALDYPAWRDTAATRRRLVDFFAAACPAAPGRRGVDRAALASPLGRVAVPRAVG